MGKDNQLHGVVMLKGGSGDNSMTKENTRAQWEAGNGFKGAGLKFVVLPNLHDPNGLQSERWRQTPHPICTQICLYCREQGGPLGMVGISRGGFAVL